MGKSLLFIISGILEEIPCCLPVNYLVKVQARTAGVRSSLRGSVGGGCVAQIGAAKEVTHKVFKKKEAIFFLVS